MSSNVYYKFKSQREPSKIAFDGTGISVFDLKREILLANGLGATAENFDIHIFNADTDEEYDDDSEIIPRSMSVTVKRVPAARTGRGSASNYIRRAGPLIKNYHRREDTRAAAAASASTGGDTTNGPTVAGEVPAGGDESAMISAMFEAQGEQWRQTQEEMAKVAPVYRKPAPGARNPNVPEYGPPPGYQCYRCGQKGHWIQECPTNDDPNWENTRIRKTTGIPRSMLKTITKPDDAEGSAKAYMITEEGEYVTQVADEKSWKTFQERARAQKEEELKLRPTDPELVCPLSHHLFENPVKTPCCNKTYSELALHQALLDSDFVCPNCSKEDVLLDQLVPDTEMETNLQAYKEKHEIGDANNVATSSSTTTTTTTTTKRKRDSDGESENEEAEPETKVRPTEERKDARTHGLKSYDSILDGRTAFGTKIQRNKSPDFSVF